LKYDWSTLELKLCADGFKPWLGQDNINFLFINSSFGKNVKGQEKP